jgi:hypothetical protein
VTRLFGRRARVTVGSLRVESEGNAALRVSFHVSKSTEKTENSARIQIYNLSDTTRALLSDECGRVEDTGGLKRIVLEAGYVDDVRQLFKGDRAWVGHARDGADWITTIESLDGVKALSQQVTLSFRPQVKAIDIVQTIKEGASLACDQLKSGKIKEALETLVYGGGKTVTGSARGALAGIADDAGLEFSVQDGELVFHLPEGDTPNKGLRLTGDSGLIGLPETFYDPSKKTKGRGGKTLVRGKALLNGLIAPGRRMELDLQHSRWGTFRALRVQHQGDTHGGSESWTSSFEAEEVSPA